jgi:hypothetical protein
MLKIFQNLRQLVIQCWRKRYIFAQRNWFSVTPIFGLICFRLIIHVEEIHFMSDFITEIRKNALNYYINTMYALAA